LKTATVQLCSAVSKGWHQQRITNILAFDTICYCIGKSYIRSFCIKIYFAKGYTVIKLVRRKRIYQKMVDECYSKVLFMSPMW